MAYQFKKELEKPERFVGGHRLCAGCGAGITCRAVMRALEPEDQCGHLPTPPAAWRSPPLCIPTPPGQRAMCIPPLKMPRPPAPAWRPAYKALRNAEEKSRKTYKFITFGGDGGTYDIGFQSLSGAMERGHDMVYVCYDNEAYMNTGIQRSSSTPALCGCYHGSCRL